MLVLQAINMPLLSLIGDISLKLDQYAIIFTKWRSFCKTWHKYS